MRIRRAACEAVWPGGFWTGPHAGPRRLTRMSCCELLSQKRGAWPPTKMSSQPVDPQEKSLIAAPRGTDLATWMGDRGLAGRCARPAPSVGRFRSLCALLVATLLLGTLLLGMTACVVPAPTADPPTQTPLLLIGKSLVTPTTLTPKVISRADPVPEFSVAGAIVQQGLPAGPFTSWYYDYDDTDQNTMFSSPTCGTQQVCKPPICIHSPSADSHTLMAVVSDHQLSDSPKNPLDFPKGTAFDKVEWRIKLVGVGCGL